MRLRQGRPALLVSSTSWTPDEDFGVLLEAVRLYEQQAASNPSLPSLVVAVTGRGPLLPEFKSRLTRLPLQRCAFRTAWLEAAEYPLLLGSADVGVCLHTSSSGVDLPMKVLDMLGCQLPVCAAQYRSIGELISHGKNGLVFSDPQQLAQQLQELLIGFPNHPSKLICQLQRSLASSHKPRWAEAWQRDVLPVIQDALVG